MMELQGINFTRLIYDACQRHPERLALAITQVQEGELRSQEHCSYKQLAERIGSVVAGFQRLGLQSGDRVLVLMRVQIDLYVLVIALMALGAIPVLIDRGMSRKRMMSALRSSKAQWLIGTLDIVRHWWKIPALWSLRRFAIDGKTLGVGRMDVPVSAKWSIPKEFAGDAHGLISFTSGSTGAPKGADRTHSSLLAQHHALRAHWPDVDEDRDSTCFPVMVLHQLCCGISTILPAMDLSRPAFCVPELLYHQFESERISRFSAAPACLQTLVEWASNQHVQFRSIRALAIGGSTISVRLAEKLLLVFPEAAITCVYGSTEAEPIASIALADFLEHAQEDRGYLLGYPAACAELCISAAGANFDDEQDLLNARCPVGGEGEIWVKGPHVLKAYVDQPEATRLSKIISKDGHVWHRTGDVGFMDHHHRLWMVGRYWDRLQWQDQVVWPFVVEKQIDLLDGVRRSALVAVGADWVLALECQNGIPDSVRDVLIAMQLPVPVILVAMTIPVDGRHQSKIDRESLKQILSKKRAGNDGP